MKNRKRILRNLIFVFLITMVIVAIFKLLPETKAEEKPQKTVRITYSAGSGVGQDTNFMQIVGLNNKTNDSIKLKENSEIGFVNNQKLEYEGTEYSYVHNGWLLKSITVNGLTYTYQSGNPDNAETINYSVSNGTTGSFDGSEFNYNYTALEYEYPFKWLGMVFAENGFVLVPEGTSNMTFEAVWGVVVYACDPYDYMIFNEDIAYLPPYGTFSFSGAEDEVALATDYTIGENVDGKGTVTGFSYINGSKNSDGTYIPKSSDSNSGATKLDAVASLNGAYNVVDKILVGKSNRTVYDAVIMLIDDLGQVSSQVGESSTAKIATGYDEVFGVYGGNDKFGRITKDIPLTVKAESLDYDFYLRVQRHGMFFISSIRFDRIKENSLANYYISDRNGNQIKKWPKNYDTGWVVSLYNDVNVNVAIFTETSVMNGEFECDKFLTLRILGGRCGARMVNHLYNPRIKYVLFGGNCLSDRWSGFNYTNGGNNCSCQRKPTLCVIGGKITNIYLGGLSTNHVINSDIYAYISGGEITNFYGGAAGIVKRNVNIKLKDTRINNFYGGCSYDIAKIEGNLNLYAENCIFSGNVYVASQYGDIEQNVNAEFVGCTFNQNLFGSGTGLTSNSSVRVKTYTVATMGDFISGNKDVEIKYGDASERIWNDPFQMIGYNESKKSIVTYYNYMASVNGNNMEFHIYKNEASLSQAKVLGNVDLNIRDSVINGNLYGGGNNGCVYGKIDLNLVNTEIKGNIYGASKSASTVNSIRIYDEQGLTIENAPVIVYNNSNKSVSSRNNNCGMGTSHVYYWTDNVDVRDGTYAENNDMSGYEIIVNKRGIFYAKNSVTSKVIALAYSENAGSLGQVSGKITLNLENSKVIGNVYGGGEEGSVENDCKIIINGGNYKDVYGGGFAGKVNGNTEIEIGSGSYENVFGGCDQNFVTGNTVVNIESKNNKEIVITGLVYGGGRGVDSNNDGDASDFTTVYGNSTVMIKGIHTNVENYGSLKLGKVVGNINVTFEDYWTGNATSPYKRMNGIDKATNVNFVRSYVLLENRAVGGALKGIESIGNLSIPVGSGLKISANGEISGNFAGRRRIVFR